MFLNVNLLKLLTMKNNSLARIINNEIKNKTDMIKK